MILVLLIIATKTSLKVASPIWIGYKVNKHLNIPLFKFPNSNKNKQSVLVDKVTLIGLFFYPLEGFPQPPFAHDP